MEIYLDHQATTPLDPRVFEAMEPWLRNEFGNAASRSHAPGNRAADAVAKAREQIAALIGAPALSMIFTSGATESLNLAIKGLATQYGDKKRHFITSRTEHPAVLDCVDWLETQGFEITRLDVDRFGVPDEEMLRNHLRDDTLAVVLMAANNEVGAVPDLERIGSIIHESGVFFVCDGAQAVGKIPVDVERMKIDLLAISAHKFYGPKGVGALFIRRKNPRVRLHAQMHGGGHERGYRSGTLNVPGIVGLGMAAQIAASEMSHDREHLSTLSQHFLRCLDDTQTYYEINGPMKARLPGNLNLRFPDIPSAMLIEHTPELAISAGSACTSAVPKPSHVLRAMGLSGEAASECVRIGVGRFTTADEISQAADIIAQAVQTLKQSGDLESRAMSCSL